MHQNFSLTVQLLKPPQNSHDFHYNEETNTDLFIEKKWFKRVDLDLKGRLLIF